ncbi:Hsp20/alpha crystallin family protein [Candidatus Hecatella orcuttiae]|jgi:HSP20 family protein|uniref:Hsp20/alpha crystallin family protein n=1 Tax=Candidatus Hecatella orcuttiae TaxID=1935119 RepID=UPI002867B6B8|nr:Hsp20/alpha crystallin family protein [Candidatus Hecatella orcuttiae]
MVEKTKVTVAPSTCVDHDRERYYVEVEFPGVEKKDIELELGEQTFCVRAVREDLEYSGCYYLAHPVDVDKAEATYESGLLKITVPLKQPLRGRKIPVK